MSAHLPKVGGPVAVAEGPLALVELGGNVERERAERLLEAPGGAVVEDVRDDGQKQLPDHKRRLLQQQHHHQQALPPSKPRVVTS
eukprot:418726-Pyramimonas_sp.AAC.1